MTSALVYGLEMLCYTGNILSGIIAFNIWRMQEKTHFNRMFLVYFAIDCLIGILEPYFLFKIEKERLAQTVKSMNLISNVFSKIVKKKCPIIVKPKS